MSNSRTLRRARVRFRQSVEDFAVPLVEQPLLLGKLQLGAIVDLDPLAKIEPLQAHRPAEVASLERRVVGQRWQGRGQVAQFPELLEENWTLSRSTDQKHQLTRTRETQIAER